ncbi:unnamed protein product, partial [Lymnaea stagnalis]
TANVPTTTTTADASTNTTTANVPTTATTANVPTTTSTADVPTNTATANVTTTATTADVPTNTTTADVPTTTTTADVPTNTTTADVPTNTTTAEVPSLLTTSIAPNTITDPTFRTNSTAQQVGSKSISPSSSSHQSISQSSSSHQSISQSSSSSHQSISPSSSSHQSISPSSSPHQSIISSFVSSDWSSRHFGSLEYTSFQGSDATRTTHPVEFSNSERLASASQIITTSPQIQTSSQLKFVSTLETSRLTSVNSSLVTQSGEILISTSKSTFQTHPTATPTTKLSFELTPHTSTVSYHPGDTLTPHTSTVSYHLGDTLPYSSGYGNIKSPTIYDILPTRLTEVQGHQSFHSLGEQIHRDSSSRLYEMTSSVSPSRVSTSSDSFHFQWSRSVTPTESSIFSSRSDSEVIASVESMTLLSLNSDSHSLEQFNSVSSVIQGSLISLTDASAAVTPESINTNAHTLVYSDSNIQTHSTNITAFQTMSASSPALTDRADPTTSSSSTLSQPMWTVEPSRPHTSPYTTSTMMVSLDENNVTNLTTPTSPSNLYILFTFTTSDCTSLTHSPYIEELKLKICELFTKLSHNINITHISIEDPQCVHNTIVVNFKDTISSLLITNLENFILGKGEPSHFHLGPEGNKILFNITHWQKMDQPAPKSSRGAGEVAVITTAVCVCVALIATGVVILVKEFYYKKINKRINFMEPPNFFFKSA